MKQSANEGSTFSVKNSVDMKNKIVSVNKHGPISPVMYLLPNILTAGNLFGGFYAIVLSTDPTITNLQTAAAAIFAAFLCDGFDGRVARLTHTESVFGAEFDSITDMVSFGIAPAILLHQWALKGQGLMGTLISFLYVLCAASRLAKFNALHKTGAANNGFFEGLPSPAAASLACGLVWTSLERDLLPIKMIADFLSVHLSHHVTHDQVIAACTILIALTMVSTIPFFSGKRYLTAKGSKYGWVIWMTSSVGVWVSCLIAGLSYQWYGIEILWAITVTYTIVGFLAYPFPPLL